MRTQAKCLGSDDHKTDQNTCTKRERAVLHCTDHANERNETNRKRECFADAACLCTGEHANDREQNEKKLLALMKEEGIIG